jgi:hypothetical protein
MGNVPGIIFYDDLYRCFLRINSEPDLSFERLASFPDRENALDKPFAPPAGLAAVAVVKDHCRSDPVRVSRDKLI